MGRAYTILGSISGRITLIILAFLVASVFPQEGGSAESSSGTVKIIFLHHSTGENIWNGGVPDWFAQYNARHNTDYQIEEQAFPKDSPYGWENYPYDYWNIWVKHAGNGRYKDEPTLEILTKEYAVVILKHCFPVSDIEEDSGAPDINSPEKQIGNYKLQYNALKEKMRSFPDNLFIVWTGAAQVKEATDEAYARRAQQFFDWVRKEWDEAGDNIFVWDFHTLETEGGLYFKTTYAADPYDSHPNEHFAKKVAPYFCQRIVNVIQGKGDTSSITGE